MRLGIKKSLLFVPRSAFTIFVQNTNIGCASALKRVNSFVPRSAFTIFAKCNLRVQR